MPWEAPVEKQEGPHLQPSVATQLTGKTSGNRRENANKTSIPEIHVALRRRAENVGVLTDKQINLEDFLLFLRVFFFPLNSLILPHPPPLPLPSR